MLLGPCSLQLQSASCWVSQDFPVSPGRRDSLHQGLQGRSWQLSCWSAKEQHKPNQKTEQTILLYTLNETKFSHMIPVVAQSTVHIPQMISSNWHDIKRQIYTGKFCSYFLSNKSTNLDYLNCILKSGLKLELVKPSLPQWLHACQTSWCQGQFPHRKRFFEHHSSTLSHTPEHLTQCHAWV